MLISESNNPSVITFTVVVEERCLSNRICQPTKCRKCPINTYSNGGKNAKCLKCPYDNPVTNGLHNGSMWGYDEEKGFAEREFTRDIYFSLTNNLPIMKLRLLVL